MSSGQPQPSAEANEDSIFEYSFDDPKKLETLMASDGIFAFSLFRNLHDLEFAYRAYQFMQGLSKYLELTKRGQFKNWVVLVYVDTSLFEFSDYEDPVFLDKEIKKSIDWLYDGDYISHSYRWSQKQKDDERLKHKGYVQKNIDDTIRAVKDLVDTLQKDEKCIFCKYTFPQFLVPGTPFHFNFVGSIARFHALLKFADRRVCVRDADTYFPDLWVYMEDKENAKYSTPEPFISVAKGFTDILEQWEVNLFKYHTAKDLPFLIAYDHPYVFHNFRKVPKVETSRLLAGIVDSLPHSAALFTAEDWAKGLAFLKEESTLYNIRGTKNLEFNYDKNGAKVEKAVVAANFKKKVNASGTTYYGCDEKILRYIFFEKWRSMTVLFYFPYAYMGSNLMYSKPEDKDSFLRKYEALLKENTSADEKETPIYKAIEAYIHQYDTMDSYTRWSIRIPPGQHYFDFIPSYPFWSEKLALQIYGKVPDNIKGGYRKSRKARRVSHQQRKGRFSRKTR